MEEQAEPVEVTDAREALRTQIPPFPDEVRLEMGECLKVELVPDSALDLNLRMAASSYRDQNSKDGRTGRAARRDRMRAMAKALRAALTAHDAIEGTDIHPLLVSDPEAEFKQVEGLVRPASALDAHF